MKLGKRKKPELKLKYGFNKNNLGEIKKKKKLLAYLLAYRYSSLHCNRQ